ncbi:hypothetical protein [Noviherbaspirillum denitrificans]|uniref:Uncharacterized protein n=1 Tax=Noviherbaspirillum denitrificans TaxID=1968433 RepID=A0A254TJ39_9BURK|nr:hypothetical protein [Noviherbaspirillum denitrificans]OWW22649.1 hypothetical protein AYR66_27260 [Noviherbaspirillum denitrificans]
MHKNLRVPPRTAVLLALVLLPALSLARIPDANECVEAGDFIKNAAHARDSGMAEADFISRIRDDIEIIRAFPPHLRWFVQDEEDAEFLIAAATDVFRKPRLAAEHQRDFVKSCLVKAGNKPKYSL